jgi:hypothetical protein
MAATKGRTVPASIETAQVIDVHPESYTVSVVTQFTQKAIVELAFASPYHHFANGEGIFFMPEVGSLCWVCFPSDGGKPFVLAWAPARDKDDTLRSNRPTLNPGDIFLGTRDENQIILRRGGVLQIAGGPLCQRLFIPVNNTISDFCENFGLHALGGDLEWTVERAETTTDGRRPAHLRIKAKEFASDEGYVATLEIGSHGDRDPSILSLNIFESGEKDAAVKVSVLLDKTGNLSFTVKQSVTWTVTQDVVLDVGGNVVVDVPSSKKIQLGKGADEPLVLGNVLKQALTDLATAGMIMSPVGPCTINPTWKSTYVDNPDTNVVSKNKFTKRD